MDQGRTRLGFMGVAATTDPTSILIFVNVPVGHVQITAKPNALKGPSSVIGANVWAGAITQVLVFPSPLP
jgi:hypothetical protein